jgi:cytochrome c
MKRVLLSALILILPSAALAAGDAAKGEQVFKTCAICHNIGPGAKIKLGPPLNGVDGREVGSWPGFSYSKGLLDQKAQGKKWTDATLDKWLENPRADVPGTKMIFAGLKSAEQRADVIAYLKQFDLKGEKKK